MSGTDGRYQNGDQQAVVAVTDDDLATAFLGAVANNDDGAIELAGALARAVLDREVVAKAVEVLRGLENGSPFALLRAIELAQLMHQRGSEASAENGRG